MDVKIDLAPMVALEERAREALSKDNIMAAILEGAHMIGFTAQRDHLFDNYTFTFENSIRPVQGDNFVEVGPVESDFDNDDEGFYAPIVVSRGRFNIESHATDGLEHIQDRLSRLVTSG